MTGGERDLSTPLRALRLAPVLVERPWGGRRLVRFGKELPAQSTVGESWEVADLPSHVAPHVVDPRSRVVSGPLAGMSLHELIERFGCRLLGSAPPTGEGDFPLLVKILDAHQNLSVQVHPHADYASSHPSARLKTESWYVMDAEPGSRLFLGTEDGVSFDDLRDAAGTPAFGGLLRSVPAIPGEFHHLPAGLVHALGEGVMVAEVQTPSDTTFRIYDWSEEYGREPRPLHLDESLATIAIDPPGATHLPALDAPGVRHLEQNDHYWIREHRVSQGPVTLDLRPEVRILLFVSGVVAVDGSPVSAGATVLVPAEAIGSSTIEARQATTMLEIGLGPGAPGRE